VTGLNRGESSMWVVRVASDRPYTFIVLAVLIVLIVLYRYANQFPRGATR
jgi:hypothetical protein